MPMPLKSVIIPALVKMKMCKMQGQAMRRNKRKFSAIKNIVLSM
jgi:hypothetical protein